MDPMMILAGAAVLVVAGILIFGIGSFGRDDEDSAKRGNRLMQWRLGAQAVAVIIILIAIMMRNNGG